MRTEWNQNVHLLGTLFVPNLLHSFGSLPLHLHRVKLVAKLQQRKETETSQYSLDHWHWHSSALSWAASFHHRTLLSSLGCIFHFFVCSMKTLIFTYLTAIIFRCSFLSECFGMINKIIHVQTETENHIHVHVLELYKSRLTGPRILHAVFGKLTTIRITVVHNFFIMLRLSSAQLTNLQGESKSCGKVPCKILENFVKLLPQLCPFRKFFSLGSESFMSCWTAFWN